MDDRTGVAPCSRSFRSVQGWRSSGVPFEGTFDLITCLRVLEHVDHTDAGIRALGSRLSPGGRLALTTPNLNGHIPFWPDPFDIGSDPRLRARDGLVGGSRPCVRS